MDRRNFLATVTGAATTVGLAGCAELSSDDSEEPSLPNSDSTGDGTADGSVENTPEQAVVQYFEGVAAGDREIQDAVLYSDGQKQAELGELTDSQLEQHAEAISIEVQEVTVLDQDETTAIVDFSIIQETDEGGSSATGAFDMRIEDNRWTIVDDATIDRTGEITEDIPADPEGIVRQYFQAVDVTDVDRMAALIHSDSPFAEQIPFDPDSFAQVDATVEETTLLDEADEQAVVEAVVTTVVGESVTEQNRIALQREDGDWRLWGTETDLPAQDDDSEITDEIPDDPEAIIEQFYAALSIWDVERISELEHRDSPTSFTELFEEGTLDLYDIHAEEITLQSESDDERIYDVLVVFAGLGDESSSEDEVTLRTDNGDWRVWVESADEE